LKGHGFTRRGELKKANVGGFLKGHDFSRAARKAKTPWALQAAEKVSD
jgi:hypothetical protein